MASKAKNAPEAHFPRENWGGGGGIEVRDMTLASLRNLGAKVSEMSFLHLNGFFNNMQLYHSTE